MIKFVVKELQYNTEKISVGVGQVRNQGVKCLSIFIKDLNTFL